MKKDKDAMKTKLAHWLKDVEETELKSFYTISETLQANYPEVLNYFDNRSTNASAESFNAKIKSLRADFRGVSDLKFFLFRLTKIYA